MERIMIDNQMTTAQPVQARLSPLALASGFGVAGVLATVLLGAMGTMGGGWMHGSTGGGFGNGGWMMGGGSGYGGGSMMGGGLSMFAFALMWGFLGGAFVGGVSAWVYNAVVARNVTTASRL